MRPFSGSLGMATVVSAVVVTEVPDCAIAFGAPVRVVNYRE